jgi:arylsulfatase A-like enzyme
LDDFYNVGEGGFESQGWAKFREKWLPNHARLSAEAFTFPEHRCASVACTPSRASLFTGLSPWQHGVCQTDGFAKLAGDPKMVWLQPDGPRTLGHRFRDAGYETVIS